MVLHLPYVDSDLHGIDKNHYYSVHHMRSYNFHQVQIVHLQVQLTHQFLQNLFLSKQILQQQYYYHLNQNLSFGFPHITYQQHQDLIQPHQSVLRKR
jgi:hypothetical protein